MEKKYSVLFLTIFLVFLSLSLFHSHTIDYLISSSEEIRTEHNDHIIDPLLDSDFNCTILALYDSLTIQILTNDLDQKLVLSSVLREYLHNFTFLSNLKSNQLRAPPIQLV